MNQNVKNQEKKVENQEIVDKNGHKHQIVNHMPLNK
jgi:hypothetical protein